MASRGRPRGFDRDLALLRAMNTFWERGYQATSLADLTSAMGIAAPSLYAAFGSKAELFQEAVRLYQRTECAPIEDSMRAAPSAREAVSRLLRQNADAYTAPDTPPGCLVVLGAINCTEESAGARDFLAEQRRADLAALSARLNRGVEDGDVPAGTDVDVLAAFYTSVLYGLSIHARDGMSRAHMQGIVDVALAAWDALAAPHAARPASVLGG